MREKIKDIVFNAILHFNAGDDEQLYGAIKQILALIPDERTVVKEIKRELEKKLTTRNEVDIKDKKVKPHHNIHFTADWWQVFWERY